MLRYFKSHFFILFFFDVVVKFLTIMPSDMHKKKYKKLILRAKRDSKKINNSPETKTHVTHIMQSAIQTQNIVYQTSSSRKIFRKRRTAQNINNTSNRLYFLPTNFSNKRLHIHHDHLLRRTSNCIHSLIILSNILFIRYVCKFLFRLICCYFLLVYHIFPFWKKNHCVYILIKKIVSIFYVVVDVFIF